MKKIIIIGGGIAGLTAAYLLAASKRFDVTVIERNKKVGGLLRSFYYPEAGYFDYGAHNFLETGIADIDDLFINSLGADNWQQTITANGQIRALTGLLYSNKVQQNSPFIDLRGLPNLPELISGFFLNIERQKNLDSVHKFDLADNAHQHSIKLFGEAITEQVIAPAVKAIYGKDISDLNSMILYVTQLSRIVMFDKKVMNELISTEKIGARLGYTEQAEIPASYLTSNKSYYPKEFGMYRFVDAVEKKLIEVGVTIMTDAHITSLNVQGNQAKGVELNGDFLAADYIISSVGNIGLGRLLGLSFDNYKFDPPPKTVITNLLLQEPLNCGELSYIYSYDNGTSIFRIDNYHNYCRNATRNSLYPISIESLVSGHVDVEKLQQRLIQELVHYKLIASTETIRFIKTEVLEYGFPMLSQTNVSNNNAIRESIKTLAISNLLSIGIMSENGVFFEDAVLKDMYKKVISLLEEVE